MGKQDKAAVAKTTAPKAERKVRTEEQRIADLEAELAERRRKAEARKNKVRDAAWAKRSKLVARRDELTKQIEAIDAEFPQEPASTEGDES